MWWPWGMATGCFSWQPGFLSCTSTGFVSQGSCAVSTAHTRHSHPLHAYWSPGQSVTMWAAQDEPPSTGCVCLHTSQLCWLCYLIPWMELQGESQSELSLCHSLDFQKYHLQRKKELWYTKVHISQRKDCLTETDRTLNHYYFCYSSLRANSYVLKTGIRLITAVEKFLEGLYFIFTLLSWSHICLCDKAAVGGRGKNWDWWVASWRWWPACTTWPALIPAASQFLCQAILPAGLEVSRNGKRLIDQKVPKNLYSKRNKELCG